MAENIAAKQPAASNSLMPARNEELKFLKVKSSNIAANKSKVTGK